SRDIRQPRGGRAPRAPGSVLQASRLKQPHERFPRRRRPPVRRARMIALFSYGTLQQAEVQLSNYGRLLDGEPDALIGYRLAPVVIDDPHVIGVSGMGVHTIALPTGNPADRIPGVVFQLSDAE